MLAVTIVSIVCLCALVRWMRRPTVLPRVSRLHPRPGACQLAQLRGQLDGRHLCDCGNRCAGMALSPLGRLLEYELFMAEMARDAGHE